MKNQIRLSIGHRCSAHRIFKIIQKDVLLPSFFDGCFGDLSAHSIFLANFLDKHEIFTPQKIPNNCIIPELKYSSIKGAYFKEKNICCLFDLDYTESSKTTRTPLGNAKSISKALTWQGDLWTKPGNHYGYIDSCTDAFISWNDCEMLTTTMRHYIFTHCPAFSITDGSLSLSENDLKIISVVNSSSTDYFHLTRLAQKGQKNAMHKYLDLGIESWKRHLNSDSKNRLFVLFPYIEEIDSLKQNVYFKKISHDVFIAYLPFSENIWKDKKLYDIDVKQPIIQQILCNYLIKLRQDYNLKYC